MPAIEHYYAVMFTISFIHTVVRHSVEKTWIPPDEGVGVETASEVTKDGAETGLYHPMPNLSIESLDRLALCCTDFLLSLTKDSPPFPGKLNNAREFGEFVGNYVSGVDNKISDKEFTQYLDIDSPPLEYYISHAFGKFDLQYDPDNSVFVVTRDKNKLTSTYN